MEHWFLTAFDHVKEFVDIHPFNLASFCLLLQACAARRNLLRKVFVVGANSWYARDFNTRDSICSTCSFVYVLSVMKQKSSTWGVLISSYFEAISMQVMPSNWNLCLSMKFFWEKPIHDIYNKVKSVCLQFVSVRNLYKPINQYPAHAWSVISLYCFH